MRATVNTCTRFHLTSYRSILTVVSHHEEGLYTRNVWNYNHLWDFWYLVHNNYHSPCKLCSHCVCLFCQSPRHYLIYIVKFTPAEQRYSVWYSGNACVLQPSARGSTPAHYELFCFYFLYFLLSDGGYKIINYLLLFFN